MHDQKQINFSRTAMTFRPDSLQNFRLYYIPGYSLDFAWK